MRNGIPIRNSERIHAESYLDYKNNIFIFIEDTNEVTRKIMLELIQRTIAKEIRIDRLHSLGCRQKVVDAFNRRNTDRTEVYIIDGDLHMLFEVRSFEKGLVVFDRYCIENYLLDIDAIHELLYQEASTSDKEKLVKDFDYTDWFKQQDVLLKNLFKMYAIEKYNELGLETVSYSIGALRERKGNGILCSCDQSLIEQRIEQLKTLIISRIGENKFKDDEKFIATQSDEKKSEIMVSAKDYILPLVFDRLKKFANNTSTKSETFKFRLAQMINIKHFKNNLIPHLEVGQ